MLRTAGIAANDTMQSECKHLTDWTDQMKGTCSGQPAGCLHREGRGVSVSYSENQWRDRVRTRGESGPCASGAQTLFRGGGKERPTRSPGARVGVPQGRRRGCGKESQFFLMHLSRFVWLFKNMKIQLWLEIKFLILKFICQWQALRKTIRSVPLPNEQHQDD